MQLQKLPLYTNVDHWLVPILVPDNYDKILLPPPSFAQQQQQEYKERYSGYLHARHILSRALVFTDISTALESVELCIEWLKEIKTYPPIRNLGASSAAKRPGARYSNWDMEEAVLTHIRLSLYVQQVFTKINNNSNLDDDDSDINKALLYAQQMAIVASRYPSDKLPIFASEKYYTTLQHVLQLTRYYKAIICTGDLAPAKNTEAVPKFLLCVSDDVETTTTHSEQRKPRPVLGIAMKVVNTTFRLADACYSMMTTTLPQQQQQPYTVAINDTTYLPLFKFVIDCRTLFNVLRHALAGGCYERLLSDPGQNLDLTKQEVVVRQMGALVIAIDNLLSSPSVLLSLDRVANMKLYEELAKKSPATIATTPAITTGMLPHDLATVNWYLRALDITTLASNIVKQHDLSIVVDWTRKTSLKLKTNVTGAYDGHKPADKIIFDPNDDGSISGKLPNPRGYLTADTASAYFVPTEAQAIVKDIFSK